MTPRKDPLRVNKETTAMELLVYLNDLEDELEGGGRIVAIPDLALTHMKFEFFAVREILTNSQGRELPEIEGDLQGLVMRLTKDEWRKFLHLRRQRGAHALPLRARRRRAAVAATGE